MADIDLHLCNTHQVSVSYPFSSIDASINADADARCGQGLRFNFQRAKICKAKLFIDGHIFTSFYDFVLFNAK